MDQGFWGAALKGAVSILASGFVLLVSASPGWEVEEAFFAFGPQSRETTAEHTFYFRNAGSEPLRIRSVNFTAPLVIGNRLPNPVPPGERIPVIVRFGMPPEMGRFDGEVLVAFQNPGVEPLRLRVSAEIVEPIEFQPFPAFFATTQRGQVEEKSVEIINHEAEPLEIMRVDNPSSRFTTRLEVIEPGKHFRLHLSLEGEGQAGKTTDTITLVTTSSQHPFLEVQANTYVRERVYTFPDTLDFGAIATLQLKARPDLVSLLSQTLMVYQTGGKDFQIQAHSDIPFLRLSSVRSDFQDRYQIEVSVTPEKLKAGSADGSVVITTNDPEFPRLEVPVKVTVDGNW